MYAYIKDGKLLAWSKDSSFAHPEGDRVEMTAHEIKRVWDDKEEVRLKSGNLVFTKGEEYLNTKLKPLIKEYKEKVAEFRDLKMKHENLKDLWKDELADKVKKEIRRVKKELLDMEKLAKETYKLTDEHIEKIILS